MLNTPLIQWYKIFRNSAKSVTESFFKQASGLKSATLLETEPIASNFLKTLQSYQNSFFFLNLSWQPKKHSRWSPFLLDATNMILSCLFAWKLSKFFSPAFSKITSQPIVFQTTHNDTTTV